VGFLDIPFSLASAPLVRNATAGQLLMMSAHPNPARDLLTVEFQVPSGRSAQLELVNAVGEVVLSRVLTGNIGSTTLDVRGIPSGAYFCRISSGENSESRRIDIRR
jgi:hypothetical protein